MSRHYLALVVIIGLIGLLAWFHFSARMRDHQNDAVVEEPPVAAAGADIAILHVSGEVESPKAEAAEEFVENPPVPLADDTEKERADRKSREQTRVTIEAEKKRYFIGEEIYINHVLENVGKASFEYQKGGDYRGATRHLSYYIEAVHEDGTEMPDPDPNQMCLGGLAHTMKLAPGEKDTERLDLLAYRRLDKPGKYRISAGKDSVPATIELVVPTPEQAKKLVEELLAKGKPGGIAFNGRREIQAFRRLNHPIYLPIMTELAKGGSSSALLALGQIPDPQATKTIIELLDHPDRDFVYKVQEALYLRMPDPVLDKKLSGRSFFENENVEARTYLRDKSWRPEFAADVRKHARKCLARRDEASMFRGAFMLSCVGTAEDLPEFIAALDYAVKDGQGKPIDKDRYPRAPGACAEFVRAAEMFVDRGAPVPAKPKTSGEKILFVEKLRRDKTFRPSDWETTFIAILKDRMDFVRAVALKCCPMPLSDSIKKTLPDLIRDSHPDVQIAALNLVTDNPLPECKTAVLEVFHQAEEEWLRNAVNNAASQLCDRLELIELYVGLIDDPKQAKSAIESLTFILSNSGGSYGTDVDTPEKRQKCKAAWVQFIAANREKLKEKAQFSLKDPIPIKELFPGIKFTDRDHQN